MQFVNKFTLRSFNRNYRDDFEFYCIGDCIIPILLANIIMFDMNNDKSKNNNEGIRKEYEIF